MKKTITIFLVGMCFILSSCQKEELLYSCDPVVDKWAKTNLSEIQQMTRASFVELEDIQYQRAAFRVFTPEQRKTLWIAKLTEVLFLDWSVDEKQHIKFLMSLLNKHAGLFGEGFTEQQHDELLVDAYKWVEYAKDVFGWNNKVIYALVANPNKMLTQSGDLEEKKQYASTVKTRSEYVFGHCECYTQGHGEEYMFVSDCNLDRGGCHGSDHCEKSERGCGLFWGDDCDGMCYQ